MRILPDIDTLLQPSKSTLIYKILNDDTAPNLRRNVDQTDHHFRNIETDLILPKPRIEFLKRSFNYSGAMLRLKLTYVVCQDWTGRETKRMSLVVGCARICARPSSLKYLIDLSRISDTGFHQLWMHVQHKTLKSFLLCFTYKPPDCNVACFEDFRDRYTQALVHGQPILVVGDLNCDLLVNSSQEH